MLINILYLFMGVFIGFLIKYEIDSRHDKRRIEKKRELASCFNTERHNEIIRGVRELNNNLIFSQNKRGAGK
ncbi:hypothetical protein D3C71_983920 [compost metagenome]